MKAQPASPWETDHALPLKPEGKGDYGYVRLGKRIGCSREELIRRCSRTDVSPVEMVWHPESDRLVHVSHVPFLQDALLDRATHLNQQQLILAISFSVFFTFLTWLAWRHSMAFITLCLAITTGYVPLISYFYRSRKRAVQNGAK